MKPNVETVDRLIRVAAGLALILLAVLGKTGVWGYIGIVPLATWAIPFLPCLFPIRLHDLPNVIEKDLVTGRIVVGAGRGSQAGVITGTRRAAPFESAVKARYRRSR